MSLNTKLSDTAANTQANALAALVNSGYLRIYDGAQPADANTAISGQTKLAELRFDAVAFGSAVSGVITANAIVPDSDAPATGTASWFRVLKSDGVTALWDGTVGTANCNLNLSAVNIQQHAVVSVTSFTHSVTE